MRTLFLALLLISSGVGAEELDIVVYGTTGGVGSHIVDEALDCRCGEQLLGW